MTGARAGETGRGQTMVAKVMMVQGTASHAGKSIIVAALCRIFRQDGYRVAPFKSQNMSLNSFVTPEGREIGRAQAVQAEAAGVSPSVDMNPILLKPEADTRSQVVLMGKPHTTISAAGYYELKAELWPFVTSALDRLSQAYDVVVIEGAGSPAEVNLSQSEIVNMRVARHANAPVLLVGDIERGGVFASLVGTIELLEPEERSLVKAFVINKFRGDIAILEPGLRMLEERTSVPVAGVIPWFDDIYIAEEDVLGLPPNRPGADGGGVRVVVIQLPHLSNFDEFDPLIKEAGVSFRYVSTAEELDGADLIILPGSKTTMSDLAWLRYQRIDTAILEQHKRGAFVIGICGGYQMLGRSILDPGGVESSIHEEKGLGLLPTSTTFVGTKKTTRVKGIVAAESGSGILANAGGATLEGYEIHMGISQGQPDLIPFSVSQKGLRGGSEGAMDAEGRILGTYIHGLFNNTSLRRLMLKNIAASRNRPLLAETPSINKDTEYDKLAELVRSSLDMDLIYELAGLEKHEGR